MIEEFKALAFQWYADTAHLESPEDIAEHPACQQIVDMGKDAVPLVLGQLAADPDMCWFAVLGRITGANPVPEADRGKAQKMMKAWLLWASDYGYDICVPAGTRVMPNSPLARGVAQFLVEDDDER